MIPMNKEKVIEAFDMLSRIIEEKDLGHYHNYRRQIVLFNEN